MRTPSFKKPHITAKSQIIGFWALLLSALVPCFSYAQIFNAAIHTEFTFPPAPGPVNTTTHSFAYTMSHIAYMTKKPTPPPTPPWIPAPPTVPLSDLTLHTWDNPGAPGGIAYLNTATGAGTPPPAALIYDQGFVAYPPTVQDIEVSLMQDEMGYNMFINGTNAAWYVIASYYYGGLVNAQYPGGKGHYMDVFIWNQPPPNGPGGLTRVNRVQLSTIGTFTRISQDAHNTYGFCITWEDQTPGPSNGINFVFGFMNPTIPGPSISPVLPAFVLAGTVGETHPDVAFTHSTTTGLNLQFIYYQLIGVNIRITESTIPMQLGPGWLVPPAPIINDVNFVPSPCTVVTDIKTRLDATDHWSDDWAYSYILPPVCGAANNDIFVRYDNAGISTTYNLTNGSMFNLPCDADPTGVKYLNDWPVCSFDQTTTQLNVEWYTQYQFPAASGFFLPNTGGYIGIQMNNLGALVSGPDYLQVAEAATLSNTRASATPTIASSRQNDRTDYQFVAFANNAIPPPPGKVMVVKDRQWIWPTFKSTQPTHDWSSLYHEAEIAPNVVNTGTAMDVTAYPNPFSSNIALNISSGLLDEQLTVTFQDISGRVINKVEGLGSSINDKMDIVSAQLANGMYLLKVQSASGNFNKVIKVEKLTSN